MTPLFTGCATALVTPFTHDGKIDYKALRNLIGMQLDAGIDALVVLGTTGEPCALSFDERSAVIKTAVASVSGRIPVIVGTGSSSTQTAIQFAKQAQSLGADGQLCVTPYYNKTSQEGLLRHYEAITSACDLPLILYNVPGRTGVTLSAQSAARIASLPGVVGLKEASGDAGLSADILSSTAGALPLYCGNDDLILPLMAQGAVGAISVVSNMLPLQTRALTTACLHACLKQAQDMQLALLPLIRALFAQVNPIPVKAALSMMGLIENVLRLPLAPLESPHMEQLHALLLRMNLLA